MQPFFKTILFNELPAAIQTLADKLLKKSLGADIGNLQKGIVVIYELEKYFAAKPEIIDPDHPMQFGGNGIVPKYNIHCIYTNPSNQADQYSFELNLDEYGQTLSYGLPKIETGSVAILHGKAAAIELATSFANNAGYKTTVVNTKLKKTQIWIC